MRLLRRRGLMLVTGASGFVGRHVVDAAVAAKWEIVAPSSNQLDVRDAPDVLDEIRTWKPAAIIHLAYRRDDPRSIVAASANVAAAATAVGARLVHMSSDVVFAGRPWPYTEQDARSPVTEYGRWKAGAEDEVLGLCPAAVVVRTSLVYGTGQLAPFQRDVLAAATGSSVMSFFTDEVRCPVHADDLAAAVVALAGRRDVNGLLHVAGPEPIDRSSLAVLVARWLGHDHRGLRSSTIAESGQERPGRVVLDVGRAAELGIACRGVREVLAVSPRV